MNVECVVFMKRCEKITAKITVNLAHCSSRSSLHTYFAFKKLRNFRITSRKSGTSEIVIAELFRVYVCKC